MEIVAIHCAISEWNLLFEKQYFYDEGNTGSIQNNYVLFSSTQSGPQEPVRPIRPWPDQFWQLKIKSSQVCIMPAIIFLRIMRCTSYRHPKNRAKFGQAFHSLYTYYKSYSIPLQLVKYKNAKNATCYLVYHVCFS